MKSLLLAIMLLMFVSQAEAIGFQVGNDLNYGGRPNIDVAAYLVTNDANEQVIIKPAVRHRLPGGAIQFESRPAFIESASPREWEIYFEFNNFHYRIRFVRGLGWEFKGTAPDGTSFIPEFDDGFLTDLNGKLNVVLFPSTKSDRTGQVRFSYAVEIREL